MVYLIMEIYIKILLVLPVFKDLLWEGADVTSGHMTFGNVHDVPSGHVIFDHVHVATSGHIISGYVTSFVTS